MGTLAMRKIVRDYLLGLFKTMDQCHSMPTTTICGSSLRMEAPPDQFDFRTRFSPNDRTHMTSFFVFVTSPEERFHFGAALEHLSP